VDDEVVEVGAKGRHTKECRPGIGGNAARVEPVVVRRATEFADVGGGIAAADVDMSQANAGTGRCIQAEVKATRSCPCDNNIAGGEAQAGQKSCREDPDTALETINKTGRKLLVVAPFIGASKVRKIFE
jgi:hypothetical protein